MVSWTAELVEHLCGALQAASDRDGRPIQELVPEAIVSWLADATMDAADHTAIEAVRREAAEQGEVEFEAFFAQRGWALSYWFGLVAAT